MHAATVERVEAERWTHTNELLALVLEELGTLRASFQRVNSKPGSRSPADPIRYRRPSDPKPAKPRAATRAEIRQRIPLGDQARKRGD